MLKFYGVIFKKLTLKKSINFLIEIILIIFKYIIMKTGFFKQIDEEKNNGFISISLYPSNNQFVKNEYKSLAPNWKLFENLKSKKLSEENFIKNYNEQLDSLNPKTVFEDLKSLVSGFEPILMTNGTKKKFCHRHLVADWLQKINLI